MCTVTFVPSRGTFFLTSNRDEKRSRETAIVPALYSEKTGQKVYPKDATAGGTWIAGHENGNAVVLLNGAQKPHIPAASYRRSRGLVLLELIGDPAPITFFHEYPLADIEPFTLILIDRNRLWHCWWDGNHRAVRELPMDQPYIWSSATLYDEGMMRQRDQWFKTWQQSKPEPTQEDILSFHREGGKGDPAFDLLMNREGVVSTVSITSLHLRQNEMEMHYQDLRSGQQASKRLTYRMSPTHIR